MTSIAPSTTDALVERLFGATLGALELFSVYLGVELGLYRTLERDGALTPQELADRAGIDPRYAREWLEQQAVAGLLEVDDAARPTAPLRSPPSTPASLFHADDPAHVAPFAHMLAGIGGVLPRVADAYRTGGGVPYEAYGVEFRHGQGHINRPAFTHELPASWLDAMPDSRSACASARRPRGRRRLRPGLSSVAVARAFPRATSTASTPTPPRSPTRAATRREADVDDRVRFLEGDAARSPRRPLRPRADPRALHDLPRPVDALRAARAALAPGGAVLVVDERVAEHFTAPGDEVERMMYGWSVTHCLPTQMVDQPSAALGTVMRADTVRELAFEAGYAARRRAAGRERLLPPLPPPAVMFDKSLRKSVQPFLDGSEQLLGAVMAQNVGANAAAMVSALRGPLATVKAYDRADRRHSRARVGPLAGLGERHRGSWPRAELGLRARPVPQRKLQRRFGGRHAASVRRLSRHRRRPDRARAARPRVRAERVVAALEDRPQP